MQAILNFNADHGGDLGSALAAMTQPQVRGSIYVIGFSSGTVKVGRTRNPLEHINAHSAEASRHGLFIERAWASAFHVGYVENEKALKDWCAEAGQRVHGTEYFTGFSVDAAIDFAMAFRGEPTPAASPAPAIPWLRTLEEAADESGLPVVWLRRNYDNRTVPHMRFGRALRMHPDHIARAQEIADEDPELARAA